MDFITIYLILGVIIDFMIYAQLEDDGITGDNVLAIIPDEYRLWLINHPNVYKLLVIIAFVLIIFIWPYVLYKIWNIYGEE